MDLQEKQRGRSVLQTVLLWIRNPSQRNFEWQFSEYYWTARRRLQSSRFQVEKLFFGSRKWLRSRGESTGILFRILQSVFAQVLLAFFIVAALEVIGRLVPPKIAGFEHLFRIHVISKYLPVGQGRLRLDSNTYVTILSTLAQISGLFLGLYFTAISVVASTAYARVPGDILDLLMREKLGNYYIRLVALLGAVAVTLLTILAFGATPGILNLIFVSALGITALFSFVVLGMRAFYFFDPSKLVNYLAPDLMRFIRSATPAGFQWQNFSFQAHYQKGAEEALATYRNVVYLSQSEKHLQEKSLGMLGLRALSVLSAYSREKVQIPSDSLWFERTAQHRDWLTTDFTEIDMAIRTGTALRPKMVPDLMWFESRIEEIVLSTMESLLDRNDLRSAVSLCNALRHTLSTLAERFSLNEALHIFRTLRPLIRKQTRKVEVDFVGSEPKNTQLSLALAITDLYGMGLIGILLGISERLGTTTTRSFGDTIGSIVWDQRASLYRTQMPRPVIEQLEYLWEGLEFERKVEGNLISPGWYTLQIAALGFVQFLASGFEALVEELEHTFADEVETLISEKRHIFAAQLITRGLEACNKLSFHSEKAKSCFDEISTFRRVADIPWPRVDWSGLDGRISSVHERLVLALAKSSADLADLPLSKLWPDYFGQAYSVLADECYGAMSQGNETVFGKIFPSFFNLSLSAHVRLRKQLHDQTPRTLLTYSSEPIADLLELSGYALIYSELDGKGYWQVTKKSWDEYLSQRQEPREVSEYITNIIAYRRSLLSLMPRGLARTGWKQDVERKLRAQGFLGDRYSNFRPEKKYGRAPSASAVIRALAHGGHIFHEILDVFLVVYLLKRPEAKGLEVPRGTHLFAEALLREEHDKSSDDAETP